MKKIFLILTALVMSVAVFAQKITTPSGITSGNRYYIGATTGSNDFYFYVDGSSATESIAGTAKTDTADAVALTFTAVTGGWTIQFHNGLYLGLKNAKDNGKIQVMDSPVVWTIDEDVANGLLKLHPNDNYYLQKNNNGTQFGSYRNAQTDVWLESAGGATPFSATLDSIVIKGAATKMAYEVGEAFDPAGLEVWGLYTKYVKNDSTSQITSGITWSINPETFTTVSSNASVTLSASYKGKTSVDTTITGINVSNPAPADYLCFTANAANSTIKLTKSGSPTAVTIQYQVNGTAADGWTSVDFSTATTTEQISLANVGDKVYFRNASSEVTGFSTGSSSYYHFVMTGSIAASGNVMSLVDKRCQTLTIPGDYCFYKLFYGCDALTTAPALPATTLAASCYQNMFTQCDSLTAAPALPATIMATLCYSGMFNGCSSLTAAPALPATTLADYCYQNMFKSCHALTTAPTLPATTLANNCYSNMFYVCSSLTTAPALPATTLANYCYNYMFYGCSSLTTAPALPATTLANNCYSYMFYGCSSLVVNTTGPGVEWSIPAGATVGTNSTNNMFSGTGGDFTGAPVPGTTYYIVPALTPITYLSPVYNTTDVPTSGILRWDTLQCTNYTLVENTTTTLTTGWYVVTGTNVQTGNLTCTGAVNLILADGAKLTATSGTDENAGITVSGNGNSLTVYAQSTDPAQMGTLFATGGDLAAGIGGGKNGSGSNITINGGAVAATGGDLASGIGGGYVGSGSNITINGGEVIATGGDNAAGIGGGAAGNGSNITINGGAVAATGGNYAAGIGGGSDGSGSNITINGGAVTANGGNLAAGIGGGVGSTGSNIFVSTNLVVQADNTNPPTMVITNTGADLASSLNGSRYATAKNAWTEWEAFAPAGSNNATWTLSAWLDGTSSVETYVRTSTTDTTKKQIKCVGWGVGTYSQDGVDILLDWNTTDDSIRISMQSTGYYVSSYSDYAVLGTYRTGYYDRTQGIFSFYMCYSVPQYYTQGQGFGMGNETLQMAGNFYTEWEAFTPAGSNNATWTLSAWQNGTTSVETYVRTSIIDTTKKQIKCVGWGAGLFTQDGVDILLDWNTTDDSIRIPMQSTGYYVSSYSANAVLGTFRTGYYDRAQGTFYFYVGYSVPQYYVQAQGFGFGDETLQMAGNFYNDSLLPYLCFTAEAANSTIELEKSGSPTAVTIQFQVNGTAADGWTSVDFSTATTTEPISLANVGDKVYFRNASSEVTGFSTLGNQYYHFAMTGSIAASGNVMSLVDKSCQTLTIPCNFCFTKLFQGCTSLTTAPELPATTLTDNCYQYMFAHCSSLTAAPELPATIMATRCYQNMFEYCDSLTAAPALPATTLATYCYSNMFNKCYALMTAPALPATTLADYCYQYMFFDCDSLTTAPALPATTLADYCYGYMFSSCTSLTTAPALPATTLADNCYQNMFAGCSSLTAAPALPATTLTDNCYQSMFQACTSLTAAPALPATTLTNNCYNGMFFECDSLTTAPALPATTLAAKCYQYMFYGCSSLTTAPALPATTLANYCYSAMFYGCSSLTAAPALPATTLADYCYSNMFRDCSSLVVNTTAPGVEWSIPAGATVASNATSYMFSSTGGDFTGAPTPGTTYYIYSALSGLGRIIADSVAGKAAGATVTINLDTANEYPLLGIADAGLVNIVINGHGAKVTLADSAQIVGMQGITINNVNFDCAANTKLAPIALSANPDPSLLGANIQTEGTALRGNAFYDTCAIVINGCNFSDVKTPLVSANKRGWNLKKLIIKNVVAQFNVASGIDSYICWYGNSSNEGSIKDIVIENSTLYNIVENNSNYFIRYQNNSNSQPQKAWAEPQFDGKCSWTMTNNTIVNLPSNKNFANNYPNKNPLCEFTWTDNVFYNTCLLQKAIQGNVANFTASDNAIIGITKVVDATDNQKYATIDSLLIQGDNRMTTPTTALDFTKIDSLVNNFAPATTSYAGSHGFGDPRWLPGFTITANVNDTAMGSVTGAGNYTAGSTATLTANAKEGYIFSNWTNANGGIVSIANPWTLTVAGDTTVTANFVPLSVEVQEEVDVPAITYDYALGYTGASSTFDFSMVYDAIGCYANDAIVYGYNPTTDDYIPRAMSIYDGFFSAAGVPTALSNTTPFCIKFYNDGTFWYCTHPDVAEYGAHYTCSWLLVNPETGGAVQYNFSMNDITRTATITANVNNTAMGSASGSGTYNIGSTATLTATPAAHYHFVNWSNGSTVNPLIVTVEKDSSLTANFAIDQHDVATFVNNATMGEVTAGGTYNYGSQITLTATPAAHYHFVNWSNGSTVNPLTVTVEKDSTLTANFAIDQHAVTLLADTASHGTVEGAGTYDYGTQTSISATANPCYHFVGWNDGVTDNPRTIVVESDMALTAIFDLNIYVGEFADTVCDSYTWNGDSYTVSGDYQHVYPNINGCDSTVTLHLTVNYSTHNALTDTACENYTWNGENYTTSGTKTYDYTNTVGCASTDTLHLTINHGSHEAISDTACESYTWLGRTYTTSGNNTIAYTNKVGCDSTVTLRLTINHGTHNAETKTACESYTWHGVTYTANVDTAFAYTDENGCASVDTLHLSIGHGIPYEYFETACESFVWNGETYTASGDITHVYSNEGECDSTVTLHLTINRGTHKAFTETACESFVWNGETYTTSGDWTYDYTNEKGCASVDTLHLTVNHGSNNAFTETACESFTWNGETYTTSGDWTYTYTNGDGCDGTDTLHLTINLGTHKTDTETACENFVWNGETYTTSGDWTYAYTNEKGCASVDTLHLTVNHGSNNAFTETACENFVWNGETYTTSGDWTYDYTNEGGCASVDTLHLTINHGTHNAETMTVCESLVWNGRTYVTTGDWTYAYTNEVGCASVDTLHLTVNHGTPYEFSETACESFTWNGETYTTSGDKIHAYTNGNECDSTVTLHLTIKHGTHNATTETACESFTWNGETYTTGGDKTYAYTNADGCASADTLHLTINHGTHNAETETACERFFWNGETYTTTGVRTYTYNNAAGCASVDTLHLTINYGSHNAETETACESYTWNGATYTTTGDWTYDYTNAVGCASADTLHLTINHGTHNTATDTACESYTWHGVTYTTSGDKIYNYTNEMGCASDNTLHLTINHGSFIAYTVTACDSYTWHDETFTSSNSRIYAYTNEDGCASVDTLYLTINHGSYNEFVKAACESYTWNSTGETYTVGGNYIHSYTNEVGCDVTNVLHLTINHSNSGIDEQVACDRFTWINGLTYNSDNFTDQYTLTNAANCDSVVTLHLTIHHSSTEEFSEQAAHTYTWDGRTYSASGTYTHIYQNVDGCDSTVTLHLTITSFLMPVIDQINDFALMISHYPNGDDEFVDYIDYRWYRDGEFVAEGTDNLWETSPLNGCYHVEVPTNDAKTQWISSNKLCFQNGTLLGIDEADVVNVSFSVAPNPVVKGSTMTITTQLPEQLLQGASLTMYDLAGHIITTMPMNQQSVTLTAEQTSGIYMIQITTQSGEKYLQKVVVR